MLKIDLYFSCWNNEDILGFFFRHYDPVVSRYFAYDDGSTDHTLEILKQHPRVMVRRLPRPGPDGSFALAPLPIAETAWRETSSAADWVMICDVDEHLYHADLLRYLSDCKRGGITIIPALGYQMLADSLPPDGLLCRQVRRGAPFAAMNKLNIFSPSDIESLNYEPGRHMAAPRGNVLAPDRDELLLMHFKYLGFERVMARHAASAARLMPLDLKNGWGHRWCFSREDLERDWEEFDRRAVDVVSEPDPSLSHVHPRWWNSYRLSSNSSQAVAGE